MASRAVARQAVVARPVSLGPLRSVCAQVAAVDAPATKSAPREFARLPVSSSKGTGLLGCACLTRAAEVSHGPQTHDDHTRSFWCRMAASIFLPLPPSRWRTSRTQSLVSSLRLGCSFAWHVRTWAMPGARTAHITGRCGPTLGVLWSLGKSRKSTNRLWVPRLPSSADHCWEKDTTRSFMYLFKDLAIVFGLAGAAYYIDSPFVWPLYWLAQGTM